MIRRRPRIKHEKSFQQRLADEACRYHEAASKLPPGTARELLLRRARQAETAANSDNWLNSQGLQAPKSQKKLQCEQKR